LPAVSVVIPARDAADTLGDALESLVAQSERSFEAIVVDDGSTDSTADVADSFAARDPRFQVLAGEARGVSAARNIGVAEARGEWLLFLDSDDWIEPDVLRQLLARGRFPDSPDAVVCGWARVAPSGERSPVQLWDRPDQAFDCFATTCAFAIHSCLVRCEEVRRLGGFDESLVTCEDWDLWQRLARTGARFVTVDGCLALYRMRPGAASSRGRRMLVDGLEVIGRGHAPDRRVPNADPRFAAGRDPALLTRTRLSCACYAAGLELGAGGDARPLLHVLGADEDPDLDAHTVATCILEAAALPGCCPPSRLDDLWPLLESELGNFLAELEERTAPGLAGRSQRLIERMVLERSEERLPLTVGSTHCARVELSRPIEDIRLGADVDRLICRAELDGELLARVELPVCDGFVPAGVLADAIAAEVFWPVVRRFLDTDDARGWELFLQELWGLPEWPEARFYDPAPNGRAPRTVRAGGGSLCLEVSGEIPDVRVRGRTLEVEVSVGGAPVGVLRLPARGLRVRAQELRAAICAGCGLELALVAVRETLLGRPLPVGVRLRELLGASAARRQDPPLDGSTLVLPRWDGAVRGPASRRAALPLEAGPELVEASGAPLTLTERPSRARYEPAVQPRGQRALATAPAGAPPPSELVAGTTGRLPILMYHRIADGGPASLRRYRLSPVAFDEQLHWLGEQGYRGTTLGEWRRACEQRRPLPGRAVMLTFDDGYSDFAEEALPLLERHGFPAAVFVVTDAVGGTSVWDAARGHTAPLMGWDELRALRRRGVELGSHTCTHPALSGLSNAEVVRELVRSRALLEDELGEPVRAIAYPYGDLDGAVAHLAGACGYTLGFTCEPRGAELTERPLELPRLEVQGEFGTADLARLLTSH
jgi:peptidoglycan/xylan/chitin deacetylase (PgdA/CDA1 family)